MTIRLEAKRPDEVRDYTHDWSAFLGADTIASSDWTVSGVTLDSDEVLDGDQEVKAWLSGGVDGSIATLTNTITTAGGRTETETFTLAIRTTDPVISLAEAKAYLRVRHSDEDAKIEAMIPRAQAWVEDHTGLALTRREFVERHWPKYGAIRLFKGPLVTVDEVAYGDAETYVPRYWAGQSMIFPAADSSWPTLDADDKFEVTYTAGFGPGEVDERLIGAVYALIKDEYDNNAAYTDEGIKTAERCCSHLRGPVI